MAPPTVIASSPVYFYCTPNLITIADVGPAMGQIPNKQKKARNKRHTRRGLGQPQITSSVHRHAPQFCSHVLLSFSILIVAPIVNGFTAMYVGCFRPAPGNWWTISGDDGRVERIKIRYRSNTDERTLTQSTLRHARVAIAERVQGQFPEQAINKLGLEPVRKAECPTYLRSIYIEAQSKAAFSQPFIGIDKIRQMNSRTAKQFFRRAPIIYESPWICAKFQKPAPVLRRDHAGNK